jgi:hypothetical protein
MHTYPVTVTVTVTHACVCTYAHTHMCVYIHTYIHTYIYLSIYLSIYIYLESAVLGTFPLFEACQARRSQLHFAVLCLLRVLCVVDLFFRNWWGCD